MTIAPAQASHAHARHFCELAQLASDGLFGQLFGKRASAVVASMFLGARNDLSYENTRFLWVDGKIAGMLSAYPDHYASAHELRTFWLMLRHAGSAILRFLATGFLLRDIVAFLGEHRAADDLYIAMIALYSQYRGRGFSKELLAEAERLALQQNCLRLTLDVDARNTIALAAYRSAGFEQIAESKIVRAGGEDLQLLRLAKPAGPGP